MATSQWQRNVEAELAALRRRVDQLQDRPALAGQRAQIRLAKTVADPDDGTYPVSGDSPDTYWVVFVRGTFTADTDGAVTPAWVDRQNEDDARVTAHNVRGTDTYVPEGTYLKVFWAWGRWWFSYCCQDDCPYGGPPDCQAKPDGTVTWFTHEVDADTGEITRLDETNADPVIAAAHRSRCFTVYVNSSSGDVDETGNGTEARPFVNLNTIFSGNVTKSGATGSLSGGVFTPGSAPTEWAVGRLIGAKLVLDGTDYTVASNTTTTATIDDPPADGSYTWTLKIFDHDCIYNICTHDDPPDNCPKVKVMVKGTIDYVIVGSGSRNYYLNLVIEPWGVGPIGVTVVAGSGTIAAVALCYGVIWKNTNATATVGNNISYGYGFHDCDYSTFDTCTGTGTGGTLGLGFYVCRFSTFDTCTGTGTGGNTGYGTGFQTCYFSTFATCGSSGASGTYGVGHGFRECYSSAFDTCTGTGVGTGPWGGYGHGFSYCYSSTFIACMGYGTGGTADFSEGYGFYNCYFSIFNACDGNGNATGTGCKRACGFYGNLCSSFYDCTTSDRICEDCDAGVCDAFVCDDLSTQLLRYEETIEGVLKLEPSHTIHERETLEGVLKLEPSHFVLDIRETIEGVLTLEITHSIV